MKKEEQEDTHHPTNNNNNHNKTTKKKEPPEPEFLVDDFGRRRPAQTWNQDRQTPDDNDIHKKEEELRRRLQRRKDEQQQQRQGQGRPPNNHNNNNNNNHSHDDSRGHRPRNRWNQEDKRSFSRTRIHDREEEEDEDRFVARITKHGRDNDQQGPKNREHHRNRRDYESRHHPPSPLPPVGTIVSGTIVRIEPYGAFVEWKDDTNNHHGPVYHRGLIHIRDLSSSSNGARIESVEDVVKLNDRVFARLVRIEEPPQSNGRGRLQFSLSLRGLNPQTGEVFEDYEPQQHQQRPRGRHANPHHQQQHYRRRRAQDRAQLMHRLGRDVSWKQHDFPPTVDPSVLRLLYSTSPSQDTNKNNQTKPPEKESTVPKKSNTRERSKRQRSEESRTDQDSSSSSSSSSSDDSSSSSSDDSSSTSSHRPRSSRRRNPQKRSRPSRRPRHSSSYSSAGEDQPKKTTKHANTEHSSSPVPENKVTFAQEEDHDALKSQALANASQTTAAPENSDDDDSVGPQPPPLGDGAMDDWQGTAAAAAAGGAGQYGKALLPGEGQAMASFVQQNLRVPRRGEIGYNADEIEKYEQSGYVMSGSRHARMNAVRIRKENQVYSAEEQRALALITLQENQRKEAELVEDWKELLQAKKDQTKQKAQQQQQATQQSLA